MWGVQAHEPNCVGTMSEEQLRKELMDLRSGAKEPTHDTVRQLEARIEYAERMLRLYKKSAAAGYCPECIYSFNGVCDDLCNNEFCPEHLREKLIELGVFKPGTDKMYGDR